MTVNAVTVTSEGFYRTATSTPVIAALGATCTFVDLDGRWYLAHWRFDAPAIPFGDAYATAGEALDALRALA